MATITANRKGFTIHGPKPIGVRFDLWGEPLSIRYLGETHPTADWHCELDIAQALHECGYTYEQAMQVAKHELFGSTAIEEYVKDEYAKEEN